jgi:hypothetical protein
VRLARLQRIWDRAKAEFVEIPIQYPPDTTLPCKECRYLEKETGICLGVGSSYYMKKTPHYDFVPRYGECQVRLPPDLLSFVQC